MKTFLSLLIATFVTAIVSTSWLDELDCKLSDFLYQKPSTVSADIVVIGVDSETLNKFGSLSLWLRREAAKAIEYLNERDPSARPAVIGLDFLFTGENVDALDTDKRLVEVVAKYGNVVAASAAIVDEKEFDDAKDPFAPWNKTWKLDAPFDALSAVVDTGHICEPIDSYGILRHQLLYIKTVERGKVYSFARVIYEKWCKVKGISPNPPPITEDNGIYFLPFTAKSYSCGFNFIDLLEGRIDPEIYRDKIVLIGPCAPGMSDEFLTGLDRSSSVYGVNIHANSIQAFQKNFFPLELNKTLQTIILFLVSFAAIMFFRTWKMQSVLILWLSTFFCWFAVCEICYACAVMISPLRVPLAVTILFVGSVAVNYLYARAERDKVTATFGRYVDPTIMKCLLEGGNKIEVGGSLHNIAVLFVDIRGFTTMSEKLPPPTVVAILNKYLTLTSECIRLHHGTLDKFVGDCTMAFWNAPLPQKNPVLLACRAAVDMINNSEKLRAEIKARYGHEINFGVGIHWGSAVVGNIGSSFRMDYTAIGDTVNTAARLEANAPGGKILISRAVADILGSRASVTSLGYNIKLKGKSEGFEVLILNSLEEKEDD